MKILSVENLSKSYQNANLFSHNDSHLALNDVSFNIEDGETLAIVGESGSGKSTLCKIISGMDTSDSGNIKFLDQDISHYKGELYKHIQIIFQNPFASLDPLRKIEYTLKEAPTYHLLYSKSELDDKIAHYFDYCKLKTDLLNRYPHQLSGGQLQRVCIIRALLMEPKLLVADESLTALDFSVAIDIVELLLELIDDGMNILFISHDLAMVKAIADRVCVMVRGKIIENQSCQDLFTQPKTQYTKDLIEAMPSLNI